MSWSLWTLNEKYKESIIIPFCICEFYFLLFFFFYYLLFWYVKFATRKPVSKVWIPIPEKHIHAPTFTPNFKAWAHGIRFTIFGLTRHLLSSGDRRELENDSAAEQRQNVLLPSAAGVGGPGVLSPGAKEFGFRHWGIGENFPAQLCCCS